MNSIFKFLKTLFCFLPFLYSADSAAVTITGNAEEFIGWPIKAIAYTDHFTKNEVYLTSSEINAQGEFSLVFEMAHIAYIQLVCRGVQAHMFVQPNTEYTIAFPVPVDGVPRSFAGKARTEVIFLDLDDQDINSLIIDLNFEYESFFNEHYEEFRVILNPDNRGEAEGEEIKSGGSSKSQQFAKLSSQLETSLNKVHEKSTSSFFKEYKNAVLGDIALKGNATRKEFYDKFIKGRKLDLQNPEQTALFQKFFDSYFSFIATLMPRDEFLEAMNDSSLAGSMDLLKQDELIENQEIREFLFSHSLQELGNQKFLNASYMYSKLTELSASGATESSRQLAQSTHTFLSKMKAGFSAANFDLSDLSNEVHSLTDDSGRPTVIEFWASWSQVSQQEMELMNVLAKKYSKDIRFVSICMDKDKASMTKYLANKKIQERIYLFGGADPMLAQRYQLVSLPSYSIVDSEGLLMHPRAALPSAGLESVLHEIKERRKKGRSMQVGKKEN